MPNWNGQDDIAKCLDSLLRQTMPAEIIVVDNGSQDGSIELLKSYYPQIKLLQEPKNLGFAGGVNVGIKYAIQHNAEFVALFNNDAVAEPGWLKALASGMSDNSVGITTCTFASIDKLRIDSTGDLMTTWGLPFPRGRGQLLSPQQDWQTDIFAASGGASLYRTSMLQEIGLFDEDFFAYYEDVDISFRAQLAGWKIRYVPPAIAYHKTGSTSRKLPGFTTYQTMKNQPLVLYKNLPSKFWWRVGWRFMIAHTLFFMRAISRGDGWVALKGDVMATWLTLKKRNVRKQIQASRKVSDEYIWSMMTHDLPPNAYALRRLRAVWWRMAGKHHA